MSEKEEEIRDSIGEEFEMLLLNIISSAERGKTMNDLMDETKKNRITIMIRLIRLEERGAIEKQHVGKAHIWYPKKEDLKGATINK